MLCCCLPGPGGVSHWPCMEAPIPKKRAQIGPEKLQAITRALPPDRQQTVTVLAPSSVSILISYFKIILTTLDKLIVLFFILKYF